MTLCINQMGAVAGAGCICNTVSCTGLDEICSEVWKVRILRQKVQKVIMYVCQGCQVSLYRSEAY